MTDRGRILDRPLRLAWLDATYHIAAGDAGIDEKRRAVREVVEGTSLGVEAKIKTATALNRVWVTPPRSGESMIRWARAHPEPGDMRLLHLGALLATHPFFGDICTATGRLLAHSDVAVTRDVRRRIEGIWGQRKPITNAVQAGVQTLRSLGALVGEGALSDSRKGPKLRVPAVLVPWVAHALLLTRRVRELDERELRSAPELFMLTVPRATWRSADYPLAERFTEGGGRVVVAQVGTSLVAEEEAGQPTLPGLAS